MTTAEDRNDLVTAQEKLDWVTPQISLMEAGETSGKFSFISEKILSGTSLRSILTNL